MSLYPAHFLHKKIPLILTRQMVKSRWNQSEWYYSRRKSDQLL